MNCKGFGAEIVWGFSSRVLILKKDSGQKLENCHEKQLIFLVVKHSALNAFLGSS